MALHYKYLLLTLITIENLLLCSPQHHDEHHEHEEFEEESEENSGGIEKYECRDLVTYETCLSRLLRDECSFHEIQCRRTCGKCSSINQVDFCYDAVLDIQPSDIAISPLANKRMAVDVLGSATTARSITNMCWAVFKAGEQDILRIEEYFYSVGMMDMVDSQDFSCNGLGGKMCAYTCGKCRTVSKYDGSALNCYRDWNQLSRHYQANPEYLVLDLDISCPLSGKYVRLAPGANVEESETEEEEEEEEFEPEEEEIEDELAEDIENGLEVNGNIENINEEEIREEFENQMVLDAVEVDSEEEETDVREPASANDVDAIASILPLDSDFECFITARDGPRKVHVECIISCDESRVYRSLSKHDGRGAMFSFDCMGRESKRYCNNSSCGSGRPSGKKTCNRCSSQYVCVDSSQADKPGILMGYQDPACPETYNAYFA